MPPVRKPDFFIVGAPKCGTTALTHYLRQHPGIFLPPGKEFHHFGSDLEVRGPLDAHVKDREKYLRLFEGAREEKRIGEASVWYLYSSEAAREIARFRPGARAVIMLRDPVRTMHSHHAQMLYTGDETLEDFREALAAEPARRRGERIPGGNYLPCSLYYRDVVDYAPQVERYFDALGRERVHVILFDRFREDTRGVYRDTCEFLGVDPDPVPDFQRVNPTTEVRSRLLRKLVRHPPKLLHRLIAWLDHRFPNLLHRRLRPLYHALNARRVERPPLDPDLEARLRAEITPGVRRLERLLGRDLSAWKTTDSP